MTHKANVQIVTHMGHEVTEDVERVRNGEEGMTQILDLKKLCLPTSEGRVVSKWVQEGVRVFPYPFSKAFHSQVLCPGTTHRLPTIHSPEHFSSAVGLPSSQLFLRQRL